jgi:fucose 4-O-acetylase-like acetyltransferase
MVRKVFWWTMSTASAVLSIFFLFLGIDLCRASFKLDHPHQFILTFFSSNLIILISGVILAGVIVRMIARLRQGQPPSGVAQPQLTPESSQATERDL